MNPEQLGLKKVELPEKQSILVQKLREADQTGKNKLIHKIIECVEYGFLEDAKRLCWTESDKFRSQPEVIKILKTYLFDENEDAPWGFTKQIIEKRFANRINTRFDLWISIVDDSKVEEGTKKEIKEKLSSFRDGAFTKWSSTTNALYDTIDLISKIMMRDKNKEEADALFENLKCDIWALYMEIGNE